MRGDLRVRGKGQQEVQVKVFKELQVLFYIALIGK